MEQKIKQQILELAITAPSGDNCQPFKFKWLGDELEIYHDPVLAKNKKYNFENMASLVALGCMLQIIELGAAELGFKCEAVFTDASGLDAYTANAWCKVRFNAAPKGQSDNKIIEKIKQRHVNRYAYKSSEITKDFQSKICREITFKSEYSIDAINFSTLDTATKKHLLNNLTYSDTLVFKDQDMFEEVAKWVYLSKKVAEAKRDGMCYDQVGVGIHEIPLFALLKAYPRITTKLYNPLLGIVFRQKSKQVLNLSAGLFIVWGTKPQQQDSLIETGKIGVHLWMNLNAENWGAQPLTASSLFYSYLMAKNQNSLIDRDALLKMNEIAASLRQICGKTQDHWPLWMFRTGEANPLPQTQRALRRPLESFLL